MKKKLSFLLVLFLMVMLVLTGCGNGTHPIADAQEKIELYYDCWIQLSFSPHYALVSLNLTTAEEVQRNMSRGGYLADGTWYEETGVAYAAFENACLKLMSRELFESEFLSVFTMVDDMLVIREHGGGSGSYEVTAVTYLKEEDGRYQFSAQIAFDEAEPLNYTVTFVGSGDNYVIDSFVRT